MNDIEYIRDRLDHIVTQVSDMRVELGVCTQKWNDCTYSVNNHEERIVPLERHLTASKILFRTVAIFFAVVSGITGLVLSFLQVRAN